MCIHRAFFHFHDEISFVDFSFFISSCHSKLWSCGTSRRCCVEAIKPNLCTIKIEMEIRMYVHFSHLQRCTQVTVIRIIDLQIFDLWLDLPKSGRGTVICDLTCNHEKTWLDLELDQWFAGNLWIDLLLVTYTWPTFSVLIENTKGWSCVCD